MIRPATEADIPVLIYMLRILHSESPTYGAVVPDELLVANNIRAMLSNPDVVIYVEEGIGFIIGHFGTQWYEAALTASEKIIYVLPGFRGTKASPAVDLIVAFEEEAIRRGCRRITMGSTTQITTERTVRFYERMGYRRIGTIVEKQLEVSNVR